MANDNNDRLITNLVLIGVGYLTLQPILQKLGLQKSDTDKQKEQAILQARSLSAWKPTFYQDALKNGLIPKGLTVKVFDAASAQQIAREINSAWSVYDDDEQRIYASFNKMKSQMDLSRVAEAYLNLFKKDLKSDLQQRGWYGLSDSEFAVVADIVNRLPVYRK